MRGVRWSANTVVRGGRAACIPGVALLLVSAFLVAPGIASASSPVSPVQPLLAAIKAVPKSKFTPPSARASLLSDANSAKSEFDAGNLCAVQSEMLQIRAALQGGPAGAPVLSAKLANPVLAQVTDIEALVLGAGGTAACGGAAIAGSPAPMPLTTVESSDNTQITFHVAFPAPVFASDVGKGTEFLRMTEPGTGNESDPGAGKPEVPLASETLAVPLGASPQVHVLSTVGYSLPGVELWPVQLSGAATSGPLPGPPPPFRINSAAYASSAPYPREPAVLGPVRSQRGLSLDSLTVAAGIYTPSTSMLTVLTGEDIQVTFGGDATNTFGTTDLTSPWNLTFEDIYQSSVLNWATVGSYVSTPLTPVVCGEEMMVITSSALASQATIFAKDRTSHGVASKVFVTNGSGGIGTTPEAIRNAIAKQYNSHCQPRPSYVTIVGDTTQVPTFEVTLPEETAIEESPIASDQPYGYIHQAAAFDAGDYSDQYPDLLVGRLPAPANGLTAHNEIETILQYEDDPPTAAAFYGHATGAEFFQACNDLGCKDKHGVAEPPATQDTESFLRASETVGTEAQVAGKTFVRVANDEATNDGISVNPQRFDNGNPIPTGINWNGGESEINNALNAGSFLLWHSDHGYGDGGGWYLPQYVTSQLPALFGEESKGFSPVVWSSDCDSGKFDDPTLDVFPNVFPGQNPSFGEAWLEEDAAVGFVGASRESAIWWDGILLSDMGSAIFPEEGNVWRAAFDLPLVQPVRQLGALLSTVKADMMSVADMVGDIGAQGAVLEYNLLGDPSMPLHRDTPSLINTTLTRSALVDATHVSFHTTQGTANGAVVTLVQGKHFIGRGIVEDGTAEITSATALTSLNGLKVTIGGDTFVPNSVALTGGG